MNERLPEGFDHFDLAVLGIKARDAYENPKSNLRRT
jgi:hypothetical protein